MILALLLISAASLSSCGAENPNKIPLSVYCAGSLIVPFQAVEKAFEARYPEIDARPEGHGSIQVIRAVTELGEDVDVAAVADSQLIPLLMYNVDLPDSSGPCAYWRIDFATNALGIAYTPESSGSAEINDRNWYEIFNRPEVRIGLSDPRIDSLGYRALMTFQLAEDYYQDDSIFEKFMISGFTLGMKASSSKGITTISVPQVIQPISAKISLRTYSIQLLALLESGDLDYAFEYESVARQRGLRFLRLPPAIDMSSQDYSDTYHRVRVKMDFQRFASVAPAFEGMPIIYGVTIPGNALHRQEALTFLEFLLGPDGQRILRENYQPPLIPAVADFENRVPAALRSFLQ
jgi:molybdate/tungstate transport system substrate-binding protein